MKNKKDAVSKKISKLRDEGKPQDQAVAIALDMKERGKLEEMIREEVIAAINEKKDRCYKIAKRKYDVFPSAYASGAIVKCRQGKIWKDLKGEGMEEDLDEKKKKKAGTESRKESSLRDWFGRKGAPGKKGGWVDCNAPIRKDGKIVGHKPCGRQKGEKRKYPSCRPTSAACKERGKGKTWGKKAAKKNEVINKLREALNIIEEAEYQGRKVKLNDPIRTPGESKKFKVYVKNDKGNVVVVRFGDPNMEIKRDDPKRRKAFRDRHNCKNPGPKTKARFWSCFQWRAGAKVDS